MSDARGTCAASSCSGAASGSPMLFSIVWTRRSRARSTSRSGVIADYALGLTPVVFLASGVMFLLAAMTYVEGSSLHQDRGGSTVFARYAFNELWSFVAGWAILLDYVILIAATAFSATNYLGAFWEPLGERHRRDHRGARRSSATSRSRNIRGFSTTRSSRIAAARRRRHRHPAADHRARDGAAVRPRRDHEHDRPRDDADVEDVDRRARHRDRRLDRPGVGRRAWRARSRSGAATCDGSSSVVALVVFVVYTGIAARRDERAAGRQRQDGARRAVPRRADARRRRGLRGGVAARHAQVRRSPPSPR